MNTETYLEAVAVALAAIHFGVPLAYYFYLKRTWLPKPWSIRRDPEYMPTVTIIVPTYNEAGLIERKLDDIYRQNYPREKLEVIVVDSASTDGTPEKVRGWVSKHPDLKVRLIEEPVRKGMVPALNYAIRYISKDMDIIIFTDADAFMEGDTIRRVVSYFADPRVGAVSTCIAPLEDGSKNNDINLEIEKTYRNYYNIIRVAESKIHSTPIHNGALIAYRREVLERIGGLPTYTGNNDSTPASLIAFMGYRAIQVNDTVVKEPVREGQIIRKIRRAQHLILSFIHTKGYAKKLGIYRKTSFERVWRTETYLHVINPWLLLLAIVLLLSLASKSLVALTLLSLNLALLALKNYRTWILSQLYLIAAAIRSLKTKEIAWNK